MSELTNSSPVSQPVDRSELPEKYPRFKLYDRIEHFFLMLSFILLSITGLPQMFATEPWAQTMVRWMGGITLVRTIHHWSAVLLVLVSFLAMFLFVYRFYVRGDRSPMFPIGKDATDVLHTVTYNLGFRTEPPKMGRFNFGEKFEYWAVIWGTAVMIITGFIMWNPITFSSVFPGQLIPIAKAAHGWEALLAVTAVIVWHMYNVHIKHFNRSIFTGYISREEMEEEHALELERLDAGGETWPEIYAPVKRRRQRIYFAVSTVVGILLLIFVVWAFTFEETAITTVIPTVTPVP